MAESQLASPAAQIPLVVQYILDRDPLLSRELRGADDREIAALELLAPRPLPAPYIAFLKAMGRSMGWISVRRMSFAYDRVFEAYRRRQWQPPEPYTLIGIDDSDVRFDPYLEATPDSARVVCFPSTLDDFESVARDCVSEVSGSLAEMIGQPVFLACDFRAHPHRRERSRALSQAGLLEKIDQFAADRGFTPLCFSSASGRYFTRPDAALSAVQPPGYTFSMRLSAATEPLFAELDRILLQLTGADRVRA